MWLIPSRQRPHRLKKLVAGCRKTKMSTPAVVLIDDDDPNLQGYLSLDLPPDWYIDINPRSGLAEIYNRAYYKYRDQWYGVLCDDVIPETDYFDIKLIKCAGSDGMAVPSGGPVIAPHFVLGGDLPKSTGWLFLPGLDRLYLDTVWNDISSKKGVLRHVPVIVKHHHFSNGLALMDITYRKLNKQQDKLIYDTWHKQYFGDNYGS